MESGKPIHLDWKGVGVIVVIVFAFTYLWQQGSLSFLPGAPKPKTPAAS